MRRSPKYCGGGEPANLGRDRLRDSSRAVAQLPQSRVGRPPIIHEVMSTWPCSRLPVDVQSSVSSIARFEPRTLDNLDFRARRASDVGVIDRGAIGEWQWARFGQHRYSLSAQSVDGLHKRARGAPTDMVDGVSLARLGFTTSHENPHIAKAGRAVPYSVGDPFHLRALPTKLRLQ